MACETCGDCSYNTDSVADITEVRTAAGVNCPPYSRTYVNIPYKEPGIWETGSGRMTTRVTAPCKSGWRWRFPSGFFTQPCFVEGIGETTEQILMDDCLNFQRTTTVTYPNGGWFTITLTITIRENDPC
jgi:hypothetical protein